MNGCRQSEYYTRIVLRDFISKYTEHSNNTMGCTRLEDGGITKDVCQPLIEEKLF